MANRDTADPDDRLSAEEKLAYYMKRNYHIDVEQEKDSEGWVWFHATIPDLPDCQVFSFTMPEAIDDIGVRKEMWLRDRIRRNVPIPKVSFDLMKGQRDVAIQTST